MTQPADNARADIDVCVCTFRRPSLRDTLQSLAGQQGAPGFRIVIADNDDAPSAKPLVAAAREEFGLDIHYVHAPARNISVARNACLDALTADLFAFMDDDEVAPPDWLARLAAHMRETGDDVVFGPVKAIYQPGAPQWLTKGDFHSFKPAVRADGAIDTGYTSNVLIRRGVLGVTRFDLVLGKTGGEDTVFFSKLHDAGARLGFCETAALHEPTPPARARLDWLLRRSFRSGQTHARVLAASGKSAMSIAALAGAKAFFCGLCVIAAAFDDVKWRRALVRGALHVGVVAKVLGQRDIEIYAAPAKP